MQEKKPGLDVRQTAIELFDLLPGQHAGPMALRKVQRIDQRHAFHLCFGAKCGYVPFDHGYDLIEVRDVVACS